MEKLNDLIKQCKGSIFLTINQHKDEYCAVDQYFRRHSEFEGFGINQDVYKRMVELDTIVELHFYPNSPVGFYKIFHYSVEEAVDEALNLFLP